jgi:formyl-CoA transferase
LRVPARRAFVPVQFAMTPLKGLKVLDFSKVLAGPLCAQYLGELGADVIKVEPPATGDDTRSWLPQEKGESSLFLAVNHNKRSLARDLKTAEGREVAHRLAREADVVLQGFGGGTAARLGVDYPTLAALNPKLVYLEVSGYGRDGPLGKEPGYDVMLQAFSGMISTMGHPGGAFARASFSPVDLSTGMNAVAGVLAALLERQRTGKGVYVEVSLLDSSMALMTYMAQNYWRTRKVPRPMGTAHPSLSPYQAFDAADGHLMLGVGNDAQWKRFCAVAGLQQVVDDPRFATNPARVANFDETVALVAEVMRTRTVDAWLEALRAAGVPCSPIHTLDQALAHPQVAARELLVTTDHPVLGEMTSLGMPVKFDGEPRRAHRPAPLLGQHSDEVLREAGLDDATIARLRAAGVVGGAAGD